MDAARRVWVTGCGSGLGLALVHQLIREGHEVAASTSNSQALQALEEAHRDRLLVLPGDLAHAAGADTALEVIRHRWGALDTLVINAGTTDYLAENTQASGLFEELACSNRLASELSLSSALPLLTGGVEPRVVAILGPYSALKLPESRALPGSDSLASWIHDQRPTLAEIGIALTVLAPHVPDTTLGEVPPLPGQWTAEAAAAVIIDHLRAPQDEQALEALATVSLWPLPR